MSLEVLLKKLVESRNVDEREAIKAEIVERYKIYPSFDNMGICVKCGQWDDLRLGHCFACGNIRCPHDHCNHIKTVEQVNGSFKDFKGGYRFVTHSGKLDGFGWCDHPNGICKSPDIPYSSTEGETPK